MINIDDLFVKVFSLLVVGVSWNYLDKKFFFVIVEMIGCYLLLVLKVLEVKEEGERVNLNLVVIKKI